MYVFTLKNKSTHDISLGMFYPIQCYLFHSAVPLILLQGSCSTLHSLCSLSSSVIKIKKILQIQLTQSLSFILLLSAHAQPLLIYIIIKIQTKEVYLETIKQSLPFLYTNPPTLNPSKFNQNFSLQFWSNIEGPKQGCQKTKLEVWVR